MYLYRGMSEQLFHELEGKLSPKKANEQFASYACLGDPHAVCGSGIQCGESDLNSVIFHQWDQAGLPTSGISTTPHAERARFYALRGGELEKGYIFELSINGLINSGVAIYKVNELVPFPAIPEDEEHVLVARDFGCIPEDAIVSVQQVTSDGLQGGSKLEL